MTRRQLLASGIAIAAAPVLSKMATAQSEKPPALDGKMVQDFVIAGHGNLDKVKEMLEKEPGLLNACWDWGGGDFETALEGAGHMGNRPIAEYLISKGARVNIYCAAMLGQLDLVKSMLTANPGLKNGRGPHGITLITHAEKGGEAAKEVLAFLQTL